MKKLIGFTLSEVLITLVIIGVIAAITVPNIIATTQKQEFVTGLKKANSVLQQSLYRITMNNGYARGDYSYLVENNRFYDEFVKEVSVVDKCVGKDNCIENYIKKRVGLNNSDLSSMPYTSDIKGLTTSDGIQFIIDRTNMQFGISNEDYQNVNKNWGIAFIVDVNGERKPNKLGLDSFIFVLVDGKGIVPAGSGTTADCNRNDYGFGCAAKVLKEGKISY